MVWSSPDPNQMGTSGAEGEGEDILFGPNASKRKTPNPTAANNSGSDETFNYHQPEKSFKFSSSAKDSGSRTSNWKNSQEEDNDAYNETADAIFEATVHDLPILRLHKFLS